MNKTTVVLAFVSLNCLAADKAEIRYAGLGRYTCSGNNYQCAQIDANNRALEAREKAQYEAKLEREQRRLDADRDSGRKSRQSSGNSVD